MSVLTRYISRQLLTGVAVVTTALMAILWLSQSLRLIEMIVSKGISIWVFLHLTVLLLPNFLVLVLPIAAFVVVVFVYHRMDNDRELAVMRACGLSYWQIGRAGLLLGLGLAALGLLLSLWLGPAAMAGFRGLQWDITTKFGTVLLQEGVFNKFGNSITVYIRSRNNDGELLGILIHDRKNPDKPATMTAERGAQVMVDGQRRILLVNGSRQQVDRRNQQFSVLKFDTYTFDLDDGQRSSDATRTAGDPREISTPALLALSPDIQNQAFYRRAQVELMQRFTTPFLSLTLCGLALACLLPAPFNRRNHLKPILIAVSLTVVVQGLVLGTASLAQTNLSMIGLIPLVIIVPTVFSLWYLFRPWHFRPRQRRGIAFDGMNSSP